MTPQFNETTIIREIEGSVQIDSFLSPLYFANNVISAILDGEIPLPSRLHICDHVIFAETGDGEIKPIWYVPIELASRYGLTAKGISYAQ